MAGIADGNMDMSTSLDIGISLEGLENFQSAMEKMGAELEKLGQTMAQSILTGWEPIGPQLAQLAAAAELSEDEYLKVAALLDESDAVAPQFVMRGDGPVEAVVPPPPSEPLPTHRRAIALGGF